MVILSFGLFCHYSYVPIYSILWKLVFHLCLMVDSVFHGRFCCFFALKLVLYLIQCHRFFDVMLLALFIWYLVRLYAGALP